MKNTALPAIMALLFAASVNAQSTVDSIRSKYSLLPMPGAISLEQKFPVVGSYQLEGSADASSGMVTVSLDSVNKGMIWIDGLPQGRMKAYLKHAPATYRILTQKTPDGKEVREGTLYYDTTSKNLNIALGKAFDEADPTAVFALNPARHEGMSDGAEMKIKTDDGTKIKTEVEDNNKVKTKTKTANGEKSKSKVMFYTATKISQDAVMSTPMQQESH